MLKKLMYFCRLNPFLDMILVFASCMLLKTYLLLFPLISLYEVCLYGYIYTHIISQL